MTFQCTICEQESTRICVYCTKDACDIHLCDRCHRCSDCCSCEIPLDNHRPVAAAVPDAGTDPAIEMAIPDGSTGPAIEPAVPGAGTELPSEPTVPEAIAEPSIEPATTYASVELVVETEVAFEEEIPPQADPEGESGAPAAEDVRSPEDDPVPTPERSDQS